MQEIFVVKGHYTTRPLDTWVQVVETQHGRNSAAQIARSQIWQNLGTGSSHAIGLEVDSVTKADGIYAELCQWFDPTKHFLYEETDPKEVAKLLDSTSVTCWGQGVLGETGYFKLVQASPVCPEGKCLIIVCKEHLVSEAKALA